MLRHFILNLISTNIIVNEEIFDSSSISSTRLRDESNACIHIASTLHSCLQIVTYFAELCVLVFTDDCRCHIRSGNKKELNVPRHKLSTYEPRSCGVAWRPAWNSFQVHLCGTRNSHGQVLKRTSNILVALLDCDYI